MVCILEKYDIIIYSVLCYLKVIIINFTIIFVEKNLNAKNAATLGIRIWLKFYLRMALTPDVQR